MILGITGVISRAKLSARIFVYARQLVRWRGYVMRDMPCKSIRHSAGGRCSLLGQTGWQQVTTGYDSSLVLFH